MTNTLVVDVARDLNDLESGYEFSTWSKEQIGAFIIGGATLAFEKRPDLFVRSVVIKLQPCTALQSCDSCTHYRRVIGQSTAEGRLLRGIPRVDLDMMNAWVGGQCSNPGGSSVKLSSYAIDANSKNLYVWPEIPVGVDAYILVECATVPNSVDDLDSIPPELYEIVKEYALYKAKMIDGEVSPAAMNAAQVHYRTFINLLGADRNGR